MQKELKVIFKKLLFELFPGKELACKFSYFPYLCHICHQELPVIEEIHN